MPHNPQRPPRPAAAGPWTASGGFQPPWPPPGTPAGRKDGPSSPWAVLAAVVVGLWLVCVTAGAQALGWLVDQVLLIEGEETAAWLWPVLSVTAAVAVAVPAGMLAALPRSATLRAAGRSWLAAAVALAPLGALRAIPMPQNELYLAALALAAMLLGSIPLPQVGNGGATGKPDRTPDGSPPSRSPALPAVLLAVAGGAALLLPWLWLGALGGLLETVLAVAAAAAVGRLAARILRTSWPAPAPGSRLRHVLVGGLVAGVSLVPVAAATGQSGAQLAALLALPPVGFAAAALRLSIFPVDRSLGSPGPQAPAGRSAAGGGHSAAGDGESRRPGRTGHAAITILACLAVLGPLAFADPEEISLLLTDSRDVPYWVTVAAGIALAAALFLGVAYALAVVPRRVPVIRTGIAACAAAVLLVAAGVVYVGAGQPGLYGEQLFVVFKQQADLSGIDTARTGQAGRDNRAREVYRRLVDTASRSQAGLRRDLDRLHLTYRPYYLVNAIEVDGGPGVRAWLSHRDGVGRVLLGQRLRPLPAAPGVSRGAAGAPDKPGWNLTMIGADRVWARLGVNGSGIVVGTSDSGVDGSHPALAGGFRGGDDSWYDPWNDTRRPTDHNGHGTHTLATAVGGHNVGVAPGARWVGCVNLDRDLGNPARYLDCLQFMLAPFPPGGDPFTDGRPERAPHILTNSWGCPAVEGCDANSLRPATAALAAAGIFVVVAAGNTGPSCNSIDDPPAPYPDVFTVGAVDRQRRVTDFSSRGPVPGPVAKPDIVAPGAGVLSAMPGGTYERLDGTSMATPHVAGVVALMWSANPALVGDLARTRQILRDTAAPAVPSYASEDRADRCGSDKYVYGEGLVNAFAAVRAAQQLATDSP